jgi:diphthine-ammonia ligase
MPKLMSLRMPVPLPKAAISWSAGKDSMLALLLAREAGLDVGHFLTMCEADGVSKSHALPQSLIAAQLAAMGGLWTAVSVQPGAYAADFEAALASLRAQGCSHMVFGDIDLRAHRDWLEPACAKAGLQAVFPLWGMPRSAVAETIISRGIQAVLVCVDTRWLAAEFAGCAYDAALLARLPAGVCPCGEGGEFHSFVWNGPGFAAPLSLRAGPVRHVASRPPFQPTEFVFCTPEWHAP